MKVAFFLVMAALGTAAVLMMGCKECEQPATTTVYAESDGCTVYRVEKACHNSVYFTRCAGRVVTQHQVPMGKSSRTETTETIED